MEYKIERKTKKSRVLFFPTVNGRRIGNINYARKYDAQNRLDSFKSRHTPEEVQAMLDKKI